MPGTEGTEISEYRACSQEVQGWEWEEGITSKPTITLQGDEYCVGWSVCVYVGEAQDTVGGPKRSGDL